MKRRQILGLFASTMALSQMPLLALTKEQSINAELFECVALL